MEKLCSYKFMHCDEIQFNVGNVNIMEKGVDFDHSFDRAIKTLCYL